MSPDAHGASVAAAAVPHRTSIPYRSPWGPPQPQDEMGGGVACLGGARVTAASGPRAAARTRAQAGPRRSSARSLAPTRAAPQNLRPRKASAPRSIGRSQKLETCQPHSPGYLRRPRRAQAGAGTSKARVGPGSRGPLNLSPGAGGRRRARGQGAGGAGARRRAHHRDQWDCSKWPAWAGHTPGGGTRTSEAERGRTRAHRGDQSERGRLDGGRW